MLTKPIMNAYLELKGIVYSLDELYNVPDPKVGDVYILEIKDENSIVIANEVNVYNGDRWIEAEVVDCISGDYTDGTHYNFKGVLTSINELKEVKDYKLNDLWIIDEGQVNFVYVMNSFNEWELIDAKSCISDISYILENLKIERIVKPNRTL